jgi:FdrA protein
MTSRADVVADCYVDSVRLLEATRAMRETPGVDWAWALMATPANQETLADEGIADGLHGAGANDLVLAVRGAAESMTAALDRAREVLFEESAARGTDGAQTDSRPASLDDALVAAPDVNVAIVSVPGPYAALEAHKALTRGLDVLLFSDNVSVADEIGLKRRARSLGRLVMGPGAGTAALAGVGLGFSNRVAPGPVGVVAAAGTGAQEVMTLLHRWGSGVSHVIGVGGRDLSSAVEGTMAEAAIEALDRHDGTELTLLVSKPPAAEVAQRLLGAGRGKPLVAALIGLDRSVDTAPGVTVCGTLEEGAAAALGALGSPEPDPVGSIDAEVAMLTTALSPSRRRMVGLFSGGTLAYEAMVIASRHIGPVYSNTPLKPSWALPGPADGHVCLDLGEEEYTRGRPHPMIDPEARVELLRRQASDPTVAVVLLDVVIGDGAHPDPAAVLAPVAAELAAEGAAVVAYVLGTDRDPQGFERQRDVMRQAGCIVADTSARAALAAAALVNRDPALVHHDLSAHLAM